jgi:hypothetical protein
MREAQTECGSAGLLCGGIRNQLCNLRRHLAPLARADGSVVLRVTEILRRRRDHRGEREVVALGRRVRIVDRLVLEGRRIGRIQDYVDTFKIASGSDGQTLWRHIDMKLDAQA